MLKIISWNLAHRPELWRAVADSEADVALLQEACAPPEDVASRVGVEAAPWQTAGVGRKRLWRTSVVQLNPGLAIQRHDALSITDAKIGDLAVSRLGTVAAADVTVPGSDEVVTLVSMYGAWEKTHRVTKGSWIYADASVHRVISDLSVFVGQQRDHKIIAAGDLNILFGYGEHCSSYWAGRYKTIFDRMEAIGLRFVGPQAPNGRQAEPWPDELPQGSQNVPTYFTNRQTATTATRQLDFVFASDSIASRVNACALNRADVWGASDHCRVEIVFA